MVTIGSLCTGYGGLDLALEQFTGGQTVWVSDVDKHANTILAKRFGVPNLGDIKTIDWDSVPRVDWLTAGYPCQPFSHAGQRKGTDDPRHIFPYIAEGVRVLRPRHILLENVRGHLRLGFTDVQALLADLGYDVRWGLVRASDAGAPHRRERIFIVASDAQDLRHEWAGSPWLRGHGPADSGDSAADADDAGWRELRWGGPVSPQLPSTERGSGAAPHASGERHGGRQDGAGLGRLDGEDASGPREWEWPREVPVDRGFAAYTAAIERWEPVVGRLAPAPVEDGRLSPRFVEWMMGLPEGWVTDVDITRNAQLKALGNGVVPQQALLALNLLGSQHVTGGRS